MIDPETLQRSIAKHKRLEGDVLAAQDEWDYQRHHGSEADAAIARYNVQNAVRRLNEYLDWLDVCGVELPED